MVDREDDGAAVGLEEAGEVLFEIHVPPKETRMGRESRRGFPAEARILRAVRETLHKLDLEVRKAFHELHLEVRKALHNLPFSRGIREGRDRLDLQVGKGGDDLTW